MSVSASIRFGIAAALAVSAPIACTDESDEPAPSTASPISVSERTPRQADGVLTIGLSMPITGSGASFGSPIREAVRKQVDAINDAGGVLDKPIELIEVDEATETFVDLLSEDVDAIVGPASSLEAMAQLQQIVQPENQVVTCSPSATSLGLDGFPDEGYFFRTVPSDSLQMMALAERVQTTGLATVGIAYLDDPYGRGLLHSFEEVLAKQGRQEGQIPVGFSGDEENLVSVASKLLADEPDAIVVLADGDDGGRFISALDEALEGLPARPIFANDSIRTARHAIDSMRPATREQFEVVAPTARFAATGSEDLLPAFAAHAIDCVNLIALAVSYANSDAPGEFRSQVNSVSTGGRECGNIPGTETENYGFSECVKHVNQNQDILIDYVGLSGPVDLTNDLARGSFTVIKFADDGSEDPNSKTFIVES